MTFNDLLGQTSYVLWNICVLTMFLWDAEELTFLIFLCIWITIGRYIEEGWPGNLSYFVWMPIILLYSLFFFYSKTSIDRINYSTLKTFDVWSMHIYQIFQFNLQIYGCLYYHYFEDFFICFEHMANSFKTILYHVIKAYILCLRGVYVLKEEEMIKCSTIYIIQQW